MFESRISEGATEKLLCSESLRVSSCFYGMEGHVKKCVERYCELASRTTQQLYNVLTLCIDDYHVKEEMKSVGIVLKCSYLARIGRREILWSMNKLALSIKNGPNLVTNEYLVWSPTFIIQVNTNNVVMWETLPRNAVWDCFKTPILQEILKNQNLQQMEQCAFLKVIHLFQSVGCVRNKLQFRTVQQNQKSFPWMQNQSRTVSPHLIYGIWSSQFLETRIRVIKHGEFCVRTNVKIVQHLTPIRNESNFMEWSMIWTMEITFPHTSTLLVWKLCCMCLKTTKQWLRWLLKEEARQWDMFPQHRELLLIRYSIESIWTLISDYNTLTPRTNSQTYWQWEISDVMNGIIFCVCSTLAISVLPIVLKRCRKERKNMQVKTESQKVEADDEFSLAMQRKDSWRACLCCIWKHGENKIWKSFTSELMWWTTSKNGETC